MKIKWLGHSCVLITSDKNKKILIDPFKTSMMMRMWPMRLKYQPVDEETDILLITHNHPDHNNLNAARKPKKIIREAGEVDFHEIRVKGVKAKHSYFNTDNIVFFIELEEMIICHVGDLGHTLEKTEVKQVDILFVPMSGFPGPSLSKVIEIISQLTPKIIIPIHYRTPKCDAAIFKKPQEVYQVLEKYVDKLVFHNENESIYSKEKLKSIAGREAHIFPPYFKKLNTQEEGDYRSISA